MTSNDPAAFSIKDISETLLNLIPDLVLVKGAQSHILWANKAFQEYYGMSNEQLQGLIDSPVTKPDLTQQYIKDDLYVFTTGKTLNIPEEPVTRHDGTIRFFNTIKSAIKNEAGEVIMTIGISRDVTERKLAEEEMKKALADIEASNKFMIDRELKMTELKAEIETLKKRCP
jgi:two-component system, NtrC family, sensor kinase